MNNVWRTDCGTAAADTFRNWCVKSWLLPVSTSNYLYEPTFLSKEWRSSTIILCLFSISKQITTIRPRWACQCLIYNCLLQNPLSNQSLLCHQPTWAGSGLNGSCSTRILLWLGVTGCRAHRVLGNPAFWNINSLEIETFLCTSKAH